MPREAFLTAFQSLDRLRDAAAFPGWLRAAVRTSCERIRRSRREGVSLESVGPFPAPEANPAEQMEKRELKEAVRIEVNSLPEEERLAITLAYMGRCSHKQIADFLAVPLATVTTGCGRLAPGWRPGCATRHAGC